MKFDFEKIVIIFNEEIEGAKNLADKIAEKTNCPSIFGVHNIDIENLKDKTLAITIGGDGTLLRCADIVSPYDVNILGFNMGRLGYLAQANPNDLDLVLSKIQNNDFRIENRNMLKAVFEDNEVIALNDIVIKGKSFSRTSSVKLYVNDTLISNYLADGLIISTPTGSTAYTLSAGGPILSPNIKATIIVPICPHTLSSRPLVIPDTEKIEIELNETNKFYLTSDGQKTFEVQNKIEIRKYEKTAKLVLFQKNENEFYNVLREKLHWGQKIEK